MQYYCLVSTPEKSKKENVLQIRQWSSASHIELTDQKLKLVQGQMYVTMSVDKLAKG